jgi:2-dehydro-3-deoxy-D-gluconate 5-dehydrogenase
MKMPTMRVDGKIALITGGSSGLGRAIAEGLAHFGAEVILTGTSPKIEKAQQAAREITQATGQKTLALPLDLPDLKSIDALVTASLQAMGRIDILVNNAGIQIAKPALEVTESEWDSVLDIHLKGSFFTAQRVAKEMLKQKSGRIINMSSQNGVVGYYRRAAYCSAKAGLNNLTKVLAIEWAEYGINVNAVAPTFIRTPLTEPTFQDPVLYHDLLSRIPLGRVGVPEDVIGAVVFLASEAASLITGHTLLVDGGWTAL